MSDVTHQRQGTALEREDARAELTIGLSKTNLNAVRSLATTLGAVAFVASVALFSFSYSSPKGTDALIEAGFGLAIFFGVLWWAWYTARYGTTKK